MNPSTHFAQLLHKSFLAAEMKEWIIANIATIPATKLEEIYAALQEEESEVNKFTLGMEVGRS